MFPKVLRKILGPVEKWNGHRCVVCVIIEMYENGTKRLVRELRVRGEGNAYDQNAHVLTLQAQQSPYYYW